MAKATKENIDEFQKKLLLWYKTFGRKFPWRQSGLTSYCIIISETLLQRTKANSIKAFYVDFISEFPNWVALHTADQKAVEKYLVPIGLYKQRAKRLKELAKEMVKRNGKIPKNRMELDEIPFIGQYIGNAIELLIFKKPTPLLDVNMARLLERYYGNRKLKDIRYDPYLQKLSFRVVDHEFSKQINWAILDFAALICTARNPKCESCLFNDKCSYLKK